MSAPNSPVSGAGLQLPLLPTNLAHSVRSKSIVVKNLNGMVVVRCCLTLICEHTVYTVGLYINHASAKPLLRKHKGSNERTFIKNQQAYNGVFLYVLPPNKHVLFAL